MSPEERALSAGDAPRGEGRGIDDRREPQSMLRIAEAISDRRPVDWTRELEESSEGEERFRGFRILEKIATYHSSGEWSGSKTPILPNAGEVEEDQELPDTWGSLVLREQLGRGSCANVYRAHDPALDREVALKLPHEQDLLSSHCFLKEARRLAKIHHENVVQVHGAEERDGRVGMWMDLVEGHSLEQCLLSQGPFSANEAALIGIDLCRALAAVHGAGLVHRDVKAANVMREAGGRIVLMDFSSVVEKRRERAFADDSRTRGTPYYTAPEVLEGSDPSRASDVYSLGVLLFRLVSRRYPVEVDALEDLVEKHRSEGPMSLVDVRPDLPASFIQVIDRALAKDPNERFATVGEMERALSSFTQASRPNDRAGWLPGALKDSRVWVGLAAAVLIAIAVLIWAMLPGSLRVEANLFRKGEQIDERLSPGDQLELGDKLFMTVEGSKQMHLYVLNEDSVGHRYRLFPLKELASENPLEAGIEYRLPGSAGESEEASEGGNGRYWEVNSVGGEETLMVIASTRVLQGLEARLATIPPAGEEPALVVGEFRGIGGLVAANDARPDLSLDELRRELEATHGEDLEIWQIKLNNPSRSSTDDSVD